MAPIIQVNDLTHRYADREALHRVSLSIPPGEIFGFLGPNGSGKTTLFRILSTLMPPQEGTVAILDLQLPRNQAQLRRHIGVVFQYPSLDKELRVDENLRHHGHLYGLRGTDLETRIDRMLDRFSLSDRRNDYVRTLSGGLRRRVELAKGLLTTPSILLMDEPNAGLDPAARIDMWAALADVRQRDGVTILVTTHLMDEAERCDRLAIMDRGRIVAIGDPAQLKQVIGGDVITLTGRDLPALRAAIASRLGVNAEPIDNTLRIERPSAHDFIPQLVEALPGLIDSISIGKPTLEDVFIHVTGHRLSQT